MASKKKKDDRHMMPGKKMVPGMPKKMPKKMPKGHPKNP